MKKGLFLFGLFFVSLLEAQNNLVPNPSFENHSACPASLSEFSKCDSWYAVVESPDYFNACSPTSTYNAGIPQNCLGWQNARTGNAYAGIATGPLNDTSNSQREYIGCRLNDTLIAGKKYCVEFYVSLSDSSMWGIDRLGIYFSSTIIQNVATSSYLHYQPQIESPIGIVYNDTMNWVEISNSFIAVGGEQYITIGNFHPTSQTTSDSLSGTWYEAYYYIDDVSVTDCGYVGIQSPTLSNGISLFPNPSDGTFQLKGNFTSNTQLHIYNLLGEEIIQPISLPQGNQTIPVELSLAEGIYIYRIISGKDILHEEKLVIVQ
jgi:hypothetical protein